jgi:superfamily II DNA helicase RecQ
MTHVAGFVDLTAEDPQESPESIRENCLPITDVEDTEGSNDVDTDSVLRQDPELLQVRRSIAATREVVFAHELALSDAKHELRRLETRAEKRTKALVDAAEAKIDWIGRTFPWDRHVSQVLRDVFKISSFRPLQREALNAALSRRDVLAVMPTGSGKSLVFQLAALVDRGVTVVVTPLVSLMQDQTESLRKINVNAYMLDANTSKEAVSEIFLKVLPAASKKQRPKPPPSAGRHFDTAEWKQKDTPPTLLYVTPERIAKSKKFLARLEVAYAEDRLSRFCFDEVHCVSQWGHDFRHDYTQLGVLRRQFRAVPIIALTATATTKVIIDVNKSLEMQPVIFKGSVDRPNLFYEVRPKSSEAAKVIENIVRVCNVEFKGQAGIVYVLSRKDAEDVASQLVSAGGVSAACYHGDLSSRERWAVFAAWTRGRIQVVVATVAFGLGINKADVRFVVHHCVASSLVGYYQESGRAGRDGKPAKCILYWRGADMIRLSSFVADKGPSRLAMLYESCRYATGRSSARATGRSEHIYPVDATESRVTKRPRRSDEASRSCRRAIIAAAFGETSVPRRDDISSSGLHEVGQEDERRHVSNCCDLCLSASDHHREEQLDATAEAKSALRILKYFSSKHPDEKVTLNSFSSDWANTGEKGKNFRGIEPPISRSFDKETRLDILVSMVLEGIFSEYHVYGMYAMQGYVQVGDASSALELGLLHVFIDVSEETVKKLGVMK